MGNKNNNFLFLPASGRNGPFQNATRGLAFLQPPRTGFVYCTVSLCKSKAPVPELCSFRM